MRVLLAAGWIVAGLGCSSSLAPSLDRPPASGWPSSEIGGDVDTRVVGIEPDPIQLPENALRLTVLFNAPVARESEVMNAIRLVDLATGETVPNAFLNLENPLLDRSQSRLTLVFNPGWIKRGVQERKSEAPLKSGKSYALDVSSRLRDTQGDRLRGSYRHRFSVGPPLRQHVALEAWELTLPTPGTRGYLVVGFDRVMDPLQSRERIRIVNPKGSRLTIEADGEGSGLRVNSPEPWLAGSYRIIVHPELEDVAGNRPQRAFDASSAPNNHVLERRFALPRRPEGVAVK
ncbi:MAG: hypothetical protein AAFQ77_02760 [Myxococcota bacterium]